MQRIVFLNRNPGELTLLLKRTNCIPQPEPRRGNTIVETDLLFSPPEPRRGDTIVDRTIALRKPEPRRGDTTPLEENTKFSEENLHIFGGNPPRNLPTTPDFYS